MRHLLLAMALCAPLAAHAQSGEIFIPGGDDSALPDDTAAQPTSALARCLASPDVATCAGATVDPSGAMNESAVPQVQFETLVLDLDQKKVTSTAAPPAAAPNYAAPQQATHGTVALPSVAVTIEFDFDSANIRGDQFGKLTSLVAALSDPALAGTSYAVIGHTDASGSEGYNCDLSRRRAASVAGALNAAYVTLPLYPVGFGEHVLKNVYDPRAPENRRVTFMRLPDAPGAVLQTAGAVCQY